MAIVKHKISYYKGATMGFFDNISEKIKAGIDNHDTAYTEAEERARQMNDEELQREIRSGFSYSWKNIGKWKAYRDEWKRRHG